MKEHVGKLLFIALLTGCVSDVIKREYAEWQQSADADMSVDMGLFQEKYMNGWRERAGQKVEYKEWLESDDGQRMVDLEVFLTKYRNGWRERAMEKKAARLEYEEWKSSDDAVNNVVLEQFVAKYLWVYSVQLAQQK